MIRYTCSSCGKSFESEAIVYRCESCGGDDAAGYQKGNLMVELDKSKVGGDLKPGSPINPFDLLPGGFPLAECHKLFPVGNTPVLPLGGLEKEGAPKIFGKLDNLNPSGSLKDRASLFVAAQAKYYGSDKVVLASTGNAGSAMSCAGAALGLDIVLFVPAAAPLEKLAQSLFYGARVIPVDGTYDDAFGLSIEYSLDQGGINRNTAYNPLTIEGKKTAALEIYNQFAGKIPDVIYVPVGDGVILTGLFKGFEDLLSLGLIEKMPRCIAVQAKGSNSIARSLKEGREIPLESSATLADSISVSSPACGSLALDYLKKTGSWAVELSDEEILIAQAELARKTGVFVEPSSATTWGALKKDMEAGHISSDETALLLLTGSGFKDMSAVKGQIEIPKALPPRLGPVIDFLSKA
ncbi:MAG: pyridoxal-phosphate dependent enzyme [Spirochaetales bacterium]|nr:pyridoxal-phosphate dependent enzyme [Spirochaetales bacterium]